MSDFYIDLDSLRNRNQYSTPVDYSQRATYGRIYSETDPYKQSQMRDAYRFLISEPSSNYYRYYAQPTNQAVSNLAALGFDTNNLNDDWLNANARWIRSNLDYRSGSGNAPSAPTKNSTWDQRVAYELNQYMISEGQTKKAEQEYAAAMKEAGYYANWAGRNYSDDEIIGKVRENFQSKYPTLYKMENSGNTPVELNRAVDFSDDVLYGAIWQARNPDYQGGIEGAMAYSWMGAGNTYKEDPKATARLTEGSPDYAPYYTGATMDKELSYFGIYSADQKWVDDNFSRVMSGDDETAKDYMRSIAEGVEYTDKLKGELDAMRKQIGSYIAGGYTDPDFIISQIRDNEEYGDLFGLDPTMEQGKQYGVLKATTDRVDYRWQDVEQEIRDRCQREKDKKDAIALAEGSQPAAQQPVKTASGTGAAETDTVSGAAYKAPTFTEASAGTEPETQKPFTEAEKADEILFKKDLDTISPAVSAEGTDAEKAAFRTGATLYYERAKEQVETMLTNPEALTASVMSRFQYEYPETARTIWDYSAHQTTLGELKGRQEEITPELEALREKSLKNKALTDMTPEEYDNFKAFAESYQDGTFDPTWIRVLERGDRNLQDENQRELYNRALYAVYNRVRPTDYTSDMDIIASRGKQWWDLLKGMNAESPIDRLVSETNEHGDDTDEITTNIALPKTGGYVGEDDDTELNVTLEKDGDGRFVFTGATGNNTGREYTKEEAEDLLGYQKIDLENGMTAEDEERLEVLEDLSAELDRKIGDEEAYLSANKGMYDEAVMDRNTLMTAAQYSGRAELAETFDNIYGFTQESPYADYQYMPYSFYDYYAENGRMTKEQAYISAAQDVKTTADQLKGIDDALAQLSEAGIELSDEEMQRLQQNRSDLAHINKSLAYSALNAEAGFAETADAGKEKAASGKYGTIAKSIAEGKWAPGAADYLKFLLPDVGTNRFVNEWLKNNDLLTSMSEDEKNRFFYLLEKDGEKAAEDYFSFITDQNNGELTVRTSQDVGKRAEEFASQNWFNALLSTAASFAGKRVGNAEATVARIGSWFTGEEVSAYNPAFWKSNATGGMRQGAKDWLKEELGENEISDRLYDVITGVVDIAIASKEMKALGSFFEGTKIGNAVLQAGQKLNDAGLGFAVSFAKDAASVLPVSMEAWNSTYQRVFDATKDADKANQMAGIAFAADIISHAVIMKGMRKSFEANPSEFSSKLTAYLHQVFSNAGAAGASTLITEKFTDDCERIIMEDMSTYGQIVQKYKDMDYSDSMAEHYAELEMWGNIVNHVEESVVNSAIRTTVTFAANEVKNSETYKRAKDQLQILKEYFRPTKTDDGFTRAGEWANAPEGFHDAVPDDAIVNPVNKNGTVMYDRTTGKPHTVVAFMVTEGGDLVYIDNNGEQVPFFNIALNSDGSIAGNWTDDEHKLLSAGWNYYKDTYMPDETGGRQAVDAEVPGAEPGTDSVPTAQSASGAPGLPSPVGYLPGATGNGQAANDISILSNAYGSSPTASAVGLSAVLNDPDPNVGKAAGQSLVTMAGDPKAAIAAAQGLIANTANPAETKNDIVIASLVDGAGRDAMNTIIGKVTTGQEITAEDIAALHSGVEADRNADPEGFRSAIEATVKENRIANRTISLLALPERRDRITAAQAEAADKKRNADNANEYMSQKQNEAQAAAENLMSAEANYDPKEDTQTGGPLQQQTEKLLGADTAATQAEEAWQQQQQIADEAQKQYEQTRNEEMANARQEAAVQVEQEMADEQAVRDQQAQAAAEAEQQRQALMVQEAEAEAAKREENLNKAKAILSAKGLTGERLERNAARMAELMEQKERGERDLNQKFGSMEDLDAFKRTMSRRTGVTIETEDLGDPLQIQSKIIDGNRIVLNSNLTTAQAMIIYANHEIQHSLEETGTYDLYAKEAIKYMYGGDDTEAYRNALAAKKADYAALGHPLDSDDAARRELIATFTQNNMSDIGFVRNMVSRGAGSQMKKAISASLETLKGYKFKGAGKRRVNQLKKLERLYQEQIDEKARMVKEGYNGHTGITQFSITSAAQAAGLTVEVTDDQNYKYKLYDPAGNEIAPGAFTPEMLDGTPVGKVIGLPAIVVRDELDQKVKDGLMTQEESDAVYAERLPALQKAADDQRKFFSDMINMIGQYQDAAMVWELAGSLAFSTLKTNGDPQYSDSDDMGTICTKTQAILNAISEIQISKDVNRGLTKKEIDNIVYKEVGKGVQDENGNWIHGATPCPPCYVYATWVNKPARLEMIRQYQEKFKDWTSEQINDFMNAPAPASKKAVTERNRQKLWISTCLADEHKDPATGESTWTRKENPSICPNEILLDLRRSGDMATQYPGTWKFMQKGGNAQGKAIAPHSDSRIGETIIGKAIGAGELNARLLADAQNKGNPDYVPQFLNPFQIMGDEKADEAAKEYFKKAVAKMKIQNLMGGQRWQSWSDARAEWGSDYLMEMLTMQALSAKVQTYTKVPEMIPLLASAGFEVNMSLMPEGDGFAHNEDGSIKKDENGNPVLAFSKVTGINPEAAEAFAKQYGEKGNVQPMVVGISDEHIKAALAGDYITFVIPFHGSGGSVRRLQNLMALLHENMKSGYDYTKAQSDKFISGDTNTNPNWALREAIITGNYDSLTDGQKEAIENNEFLRKLYEDRYLNEDSDAYQVFFSKGAAQQIFPYEYWDKNTTLATADRNSRRFVEYCDMLGVIPRFSGLQKKDGTEYANFSGRKVNEDGSVTYDPVTGYWKLLIDRPMYRRIYDENGNLVKEKCTYRDPEVVNVGNVKVTAMPMAANNTVGHSNDETRQIADRAIQQILLNKGPATASFAGNATLGNTPSEQREENAPIIKQAMYADSNEQLSGAGDVPDSELLRMIDDDYDNAVANGDMEAAQRDVDLAAVNAGAFTDKNGNPLKLYHGTRYFGFTEFDTSRAKFNLGAIFTTNNPSVANGYSEFGRDRTVDSKYIEDDGTDETLIRNAKNVLGMDFIKLSAEKAEEIRQKLLTKYVSLAEKENKAMNESPDYVPPYEIDTAFWETVQCFNDVLNEDPLLYDEDIDYRTNYRNQNNWVVSRNKIDAMDKVLQYFRSNDEEMQRLKTEGNGYYDLLFKNYDQQDGIINVEYTYKQLLNPEDKFVRSGGTGDSIASRDDIQNDINVWKNRGNYTLYGMPGDKPFEIDANKSFWTSIKAPMIGEGYFSTDNIVKWAKDNGYTSVVIKNVMDPGVVNEYGDDYIFFNSDQLKSADPITYDKDGNPIKLSGRFSDSPDIRYSAGGTLADSELLSLIDEIGKAVEDLTTEDILNLFGMGSMEEQKEDPREIVAETVREIENEFDPTIYNGRLYVKPETLDFWLSDEGFAANNPNYAQAYITTMNPNDFLRITTASKAGREKLLGEVGSLDEEKLAVNAQLQPIELFINEETGKITGHEGRHRSIALAKAGVTEIPVLLFDRRTETSKTPKDSLTLEGQDTKRRHESNLKNEETITFTDVIPLSNAFRDELYQKFTASDEERQAAEQNNQRILDYSIGGDIPDAELLSMMADNGMISPEMIPYSYVPSQDVNYGSKYRQFGRKTAQESDALHEQVKDYLYNNSLYIPDTNAEQVNRALGWVKSHATESDPDGYYASLKEVMDPNFDFRSADGQARLLSVMGMAALKAESGDQRALNDELQLANAFNKQGTDIGRQLQARKLFRLMTPVGRQSVLQGMCDDINEQLGRKGIDTTVKLSDETLKAAREAKTEDDFAAVRKRAAKEIAEQVPSNWKDKLRGWRMLSMLGNPRTHIRNVVGNALFVPVVSMKNKLGALGEIMTGQEQRTKTLSPVLSKEIRDFAKKDAMTMKDTLTGEAKYNENSMVENEMKPFKGLLQAIIDFNSNMLEKEDWTFLKGHYIRALGGWMQANGYTAEQLQSNPDLLEQGRTYAIQEAQKATYRDFSKMASTLNKVSREGGIAGFITDAVLPFKKTPANILKRGIEYSPAGIMRSLTTDLYHLKQWNDYQNGKLRMLPDKAISPTQFIDRLCSGLSGTAIMAIGALLSSAGIITCGLDDDEDKLEKEQGNQEYSLKFNIGGQDFTFTMDWAAPMSMPFFVGAAIQEQLSSQEGFDAESLVDAFGNITEPVFNLSMLDGVNSLLKISQNNGQESNSTITQIGAKVASNYATSYVPSLIGAIARTVDDTRRKSFVEQGKGTGVLGTFRYAREQIENKIPGLSQTNIPVRDIWGNADVSGLAERILENFILPGYINEYKNDPVLNEMGRLYDATGDANMIPKDPDKSVTYNKQKYVLTAEQWDKYKEVRGQTAYNGLTELINTEDYQNANETTQVQMIKNVWSYADKTGKQAIIPGFEMEDMGINPVATITKESKITSYKADMIKALDSGDYEGYETMVEALHEEGVEDSDIKSKISTKYRTMYKDAYKAGDYEEMSRIEEILYNTGFSFDIRAWEKQVDNK